MAYKKMPNLSMENVRLIFKNFSGRETKFNRAGNRNFCVFIDDPAVAESLTNDGWNIRILRPRDEDDIAKNYLPVTLAYNNYPPEVYLIANRTKTLLDEETIGQLDYAEITNVDLVIRPYNWEVNDATGIKAYLKTAYVTIEVDRFASKYDTNSKNMTPPEPDFDDEEIPF